MKKPFCRGASRDVVRLQVQADMPESILEVLTANLKVTEAELYVVKGIIDLGRLKYLDVDRPDLKDGGVCAGAQRSKKYRERRNL